MPYNFQILFHNPSFNFDFSKYDCRSLAFFLINLISRKLENIGPESRQYLCDSNM